MASPVVRRRAGWSARALGMLPLALAGCDIPTDLPVLEPRFIVEAERTTLSVARLLPASVAVQGTSLALSFNPTTSSQSLGQLCPACTALNGTLAPKPAFTGTVTSTLALPTDVRSAALTSGSLSVLLNNGFNFDPIRPSATARGTITITLTSGGATLGSRTLDGVTVALAPNTSRTESIPLTAATISGPITATVTITSPLGDPVTVNTAQTFPVTASSQSVLLSSATVGVTNKTVNTQPVALDLDDIDDTVADHVKSGNLILTITNPFPVSGTLTVSFTGTPVAAKTIQLTVSSTPVTQIVSFTQSEIRELLGKQVTMTISGPVSGPAGGVVVTATQVLNITTKLDLTLTTQSN